MSAVLGCVNFDKFTNHFCISNTVGYQNLPVGNGFSIFTPTFKSVSGSSVDLNSISFLQSDGTAFATSGKTGVCKGKLQIRKINADGSYATGYGWYSTLGGWSNDGVTIIEDGTVTLADGEGFALNNILGSTCLIRVSGEVELAPRNAVATGFSLMGNSTPCTIDLTRVSFLKGDGTAFATSGKTGVCKGKLQIQKINSDGSYAAGYGWYSTLGGWSNDGATVVESGVVTLAAGEAFAINNLLGEAAIMVLPSPVE